MVNEIIKLPAVRLREEIAKGNISPTEVVETFAKRIRQVEEKINAFVTLMVEQAYDKAKRVKGGKLFGVPIAVKDNILTYGVKTTCSSKMLENFVAPYDATVSERIKKEGAIIIGKTNMDEFAMGSSTEYSAFGPTKNPWDLERVPGGSSGGSAAAVASLMAPLSLGSDTGGSIRQPASFCGVIGLKPTYGRVSRYGLVAFASSLDQIGPFGRYTEDVALLLEVISGKDPKDSTCADKPVPNFVEEIKKPIKGLKAGIPKEIFDLGLGGEVREIFENWLEKLKTQGVELKTVELPMLKYAIPTYYVIATSEASSNLARYDGVRYGYRTPKYKDLTEMYTKTRDEGFGSEVKRRIMLGTFALSTGYYDAYYLKAKKIQRLLYKDFARVFKEVDVILTPTTPTPAFKFGEKLNNPIDMYLSDIFTVSVNLAGLPAVSVPIGLTANNLPVGGQVIGKPWEETTILTVAYNWEEISQFPSWFPNI
ncbi:MAG TPA: Asp-tRNA(Asn)/Glu-tRNA(Gln) amidotransferase subunit GatA [Aquifex aeolicus]|nr:Asp-tRNA(Asn)/Glu-tRNA(Gln) amidotransferase subunit GatA [Aquificales bacterium]HIQ26771.1 Asp-tRNA(Asn)/Glu-tRNA(Gln) amidotransferase subunit GatA [Aquifex aeolicus]